MVRAIERGLSLSDFNELTIGQIIDFICTYNDLHSNASKPSIKEASQHDFDAF